VTSEWEQLRAKLAAEGVSGTEDLGRFVRNVEHFRPSTFDERAAMPVLMRELARLTDPKLVSAVAGHLARGWARPDAFIPLREAFIRWAEADPVTGWHIGDALAVAATKDQLDDLLTLCLERRYGMARQMLVMALGRFRADPRVADAVWTLAADEDVALHALSALRRVSGAQAALNRAEEVASANRGSPAGYIAAREARKVREAVQQTS
jgi:hypothetical protein